jgi:hypothetical protein
MKGTVSSGMRPTKGGFNMKEFKVWVESAD